jgi:hypothetical protein
MHSSSLIIKIIQMCAFPSFLSLHFPSWPWGGSTTALTAVPLPLRTPAFWCFYWRVFINNASSVGSINNKRRAQTVCCYNAGPVCVCRSHAACHNAGPVCVCRSHAACHNAGPVCVCRSQARPVTVLGLSVSVDHRRGLSQCSACLCL